MDKSGGANQNRLDHEDFGRGHSIFTQYETNISSAKMSSSDAAAWAYTKCAMLFFAALIITWVSHFSGRWEGNEQNHLADDFFPSLFCLGPLHNQSSIHTRGRR